ncbi:MAG: hypothetical protein ACYCUF_08770 [Acidimicrobiales bacterium]
MADLPGVAEGEADSRGAPEDRAPEDRALARVAGRLAHPRVSTLVLLVVLLPTLGVVATSSIAAASSWSYRSEAAGVQQDVQRLDGITRARVVFNSWVVPAQALSYSNGLGVRTAVLDSLFHLRFGRCSCQELLRWSKTRSCARAPRSPAT